LWAKRERREFFCQEGKVTTVVVEVQTLRVVITEIKFL
jgi:hypothetical protein